MLNKDYRDIFSGLLMLCIGIGVAAYANQHYEIGQLNRMGPGFFPVVLGLVLAVIGFFIALPAFFRPGTPMEFKLKTLVLVTISILLFALMLRSMGIVLATTTAVFVSSMADNEITWKGRLGIAVAIAALVWLVFIYGLSMIVPTWPWSP